MQNLETFARKAADLMMRGAADLLRSRSLTADDVDLDAILAEIRRRAPAALDAALVDAKAALELPGMAAVADVTFSSTMRLAGINAAKAVLEEVR